VKNLKFENLKKNYKRSNESLGIYFNYSVKNNEQYKNVKIYLFLLIFFLTVLSLVSCHPERIYENSKIFPEMKWQKKDILSFEVLCENDTINYNIKLDIRYIYGYLFRNLNVKLTRISPSGNEISKKYNIEIKDKNGSFKGDIAGDYCDLIFLMEENVIFSEKGIYKFQIEHIMKVKSLPLIDKIGLIIDY